MAGGTVKGLPRNPLDMIIAADAEANDCIVVTHNERDFVGMRIVNPVQAAG
jgi:predicted nucleic acid-binding protein